MTTSSGGSNRASNVQTPVAQIGEGATAAMMGQVLAHQQQMPMRTQQPQLVQQQQPHWSLIGQAIPAPVFPTATGWPVASPIQSYMLSPDGSQFSELTLMKCDVCDFTISMFRNHLSHRVH